jgi:hypothetical protein
VGQQLAGHELEHKEIDTSVRVEIEQRRDVGVEQLRKGARFKSEPTLRIFVVKRVLLQYLERHVALESRILGAEHYAHTTFAQAFEDLVPAERLTDHGGCGMEWGNQRSRSLFRGTAPGKSAGIEHDLSGFEIAVHWQMRLSRMVGRPSLRSTPQD